MKNSSKSHSVRDTFSGDEVSLLSLIYLFTDRKKYLFYLVGIFFVLGALVALTSPYEYEAQSRILSENGGTDEESNSIGAIRGLLNFGNESLTASGSGGTQLGAELYPEIIKSDPFLIDLMQQEFYFEEKGKTMSIQDYFIQEHPGHVFSKMYGFLRGIPGRFFALFEKKKKWQTSGIAGLENVESTLDDKILTIVNITPQQRGVMGQLTSRFQIESEGRIITLKVKMPEPYISAVLSTIVLQKIIDYVVAYRTSKQRENLNFIEDRFEESEQKFKNAQFALASFRDSNRGIIREVAKTRMEQLQAEFDLTFNIYKGLAQQLEQSRIQLKKDTPLFTEFEPVSVPSSKVEPNIPRIIFIYFVLGIFMGGILIVIVIIIDYRNETELIEEN